MATPKMTVDRVQAAVQMYWKVFTSKSFADLPKMYTPEALVFGAYDTRPQPGRLSAARVEREYSSPKSSFRVEFLSPIEVQILSDTIAVAVYLLRWEAWNLEDPILGKRFNRIVPNGRVTTVFVLNPDGNLSVAHHHFSIMGSLTREEVGPPQESV